MAQPGGDDEELVLGFSMEGPNDAGEAAVSAAARGRTRLGLVALGLGCAGLAVSAALHLRDPRPHRALGSSAKEGEAAFASLEAKDGDQEAKEGKKDVASDGGDTGDEGKEGPEGPCLCAFDIDRTLTCKQGWADRCDGVEEQYVEDTAFSGGTMILSQFAANVKDTFCGKCYRGIVSAGDAGGDNSGERGKLFEALGGTDKMGVDFWQDLNWQADTEASSLLLVHAVDGKKQDSVRKMLDWWRDHQGLDIKDENVWFFDDLLKNVEGFKGTKFNARQISCKSRGPVEQWVQWDGKVGGCGATTDEIEPERGVHVCEGVPVKPDDVED